MRRAPRKPDRPSNKPVSEIMDELKSFTETCSEQFQNLEDRGENQKRFDSVVIEELRQRIQIENAVETALSKHPEMNDLIASKTIQELNAYYSQLQRFDDEIAMANNVRMMMEIRKRKAQQEATHRMTDKPHNPIRTAPAGPPHRRHA